MHISSLPSPFGIGTLGRQAREFIDFLAEAGQHYWQVLPVSPTGYGDSPYQSFSSYAGNPYFIDLDTLCQQGLLSEEEYTSVDWGGSPEKTDYGKLFENRFKILSKACDRLLQGPNIDYDRFCLENSFWLEDYALFMALKDYHRGAPWIQWERELLFRETAAMENARHELTAAVSMYKAIQFLFYTQWQALHAYAKQRNVELIGDIPIYVAADSADVWANPEYFCLDGEYLPSEVAGCPPDSYNEDGQLWGNPLYNWEALKAHEYDWWVRRIEHQFKLFDVLRIDHFRGFDTYYAIPYGDENARRGVWRQGPGMALFRAVTDALGPRRIIAEDLGFMTESVEQLLKDSGYPGMKVLQFAFSTREESVYLPHNFTPNCVAYTGTHDNTTLKDWLSTAPAEEIAFAKEYLRIKDEDDPVRIMLTALWSSVAELTVTCMQDLLELDGSARMNIPGTLSGNWQWRMTADAPLKLIAEKLRYMTELYGRL